MCLQLELASVVDWGEHFVKATYSLEGDGVLCLRCYVIVNTVLAAIHAAHCPNVQAVVQKLVDPVQVSNGLQYAQKCVQPALNYCVHIFDTTLKKPLEAFKAARLFSPQKVASMQPVASDIDYLKVLPFFDNGTIEHLKKELPSYLAKCADIDESLCPLTFWKLNAEYIPTWSASAKQVFLVQPSSASSEQVFSLLKASFSEQQDKSLQDYIEASLMIQFNNR